MPRQDLTETGPENERFKLSRPITFVCRLIALTGFGVTGVAAGLNLFGVAHWAEPQSPTLAIARNRQKAPGAAEKAECENRNRDDMRHDGGRNVDGWALHEAVAGRGHCKDPYSGPALESEEAQPIISFVGF